MLSAALPMVLCVILYLLWPRPRRARSCFRPLAAFYKRQGLQAPQWTVVSAAVIPQPYRQLLDHERNMTPTLAAHHKAQMQLRVLDKECHPDVLSRWILLECSGSEQVAEFGAITVHLKNLPAAVRELIREGARPFGAILLEHSVPQQSHVAAFFRLQPDRALLAAMRLPELGSGSRHARDGSSRSQPQQREQQQPPYLYGRCNVIKSPQSGAVLAEVVEILPP